MAKVIEAMGDMEKELKVHLYFPTFGPAVENQIIHVLGKRCDPTIHLSTISRGQNRLIDHCLVILDGKVSIGLLSDGFFRVVAFKSKQEATIWVCILLIGQCVIYFLSHTHSKFCVPMTSLGPVKWVYLCLDWHAY